MGKRARNDDDDDDDDDENGESHSNSHHASPPPDDVVRQDVPFEPRASTSSTSSRSGSTIIEPSPTKYAQLDETAEIEDGPQTVMLCSLPPHRDSLTFPRYDAYEVHYVKEHVNRCVECGRNFPTGHYLGLHIAENHDPLNEARKARGDKIVRRLPARPSPAPLVPCLLGCLSVDGPAVICACSSTLASSRAAIECAPLRRSDGDISSTSICSRG